MMKLILAAAATLGLSGCMSYGGYDDFGYGGYGGYGSGVSISIGSGYGSRYGGYGGYYGGYGSRYGGYGANNCVAYDSYGRAYYTCGYGNYTTANPYIYSPGTAIYYYPGYTYRDGYYYDRTNRRYDTSSMYDRYYRHRR